MESKPQLECAERVVVSRDELSETVKENARLKQKVETLQAILLGSPAHPQGGLQSRRARRLSAPAPPPARRLSMMSQPPAAIPEFETVYHQDEPCSPTEQIFASDSTPFQTHQDLHDFTPTPPGTPPDFEEPTVAHVEEPTSAQSRQSRPSVVPALDCSGARVPRPSTTPQVDCMSSTVQVDCMEMPSKPPRESTTARVDCGQDDYDNYDHLTYDDLELLPAEDFFIGEDSDTVADTDADTEYCPDEAPKSPKLTAPLKIRKSTGKRGRDESVCGVGECVIA